MKISRIIYVTQYNSRIFEFKVINFRKIWNLYKYLPIRFFILIKKIYLGLIKENSYILLSIFFKF